MSTEKKYNDVEVTENYGNMFVFELDEHISGNYLIFHDSKEGVVTHADTTFYIEDNQYKLSIDNAEEIDKGYIHYELPNKISCQYSVDLSGNIDLYFNYDNYLNPKFKSIELYRNSFLHLNKDNPEGLLAIAGEYKEKYEMPGAYYVFTNLSDSKPKFATRKLTYQQKVQWLKDRAATYNTDGLVDYVDDDQYLRLKDKDHEIDVTEEDFINNDNLNLAGGNPLEYDIPIDPEDEVQMKEVDEYVYLYLDCEFTSTETITGDVGITDTMRISPVTATLKYNGNVLKHFDGTPATITGMTLHGYTTDLPNTGKSFFYPMFLDFNNIVIPSYTGIDGMIFDLKVDDITMANKVTSVTSNTGESTKYGVNAKISFSDNTGYQVVEHDTTRILGGRKKIYGVYIVVNGYGEFKGTLDTLAQKVADEVYLPELRDPVKGGGGSGGVLKELDFDVLNTQKEVGISKLFRIHNISNMGLSTLGKFYSQAGFFGMGGFEFHTADINPKYLNKVRDENGKYTGITRIQALANYQAAVVDAAKKYNVATWIRGDTWCCGTIASTAMGCQYGSVNLKSVIFGYDERDQKAYMWIPYSKNKSNYDGLMFAYSSILQTDQFVRASIYENDCRVGNASSGVRNNQTLGKEFLLDDYDFVDIPEGYQATLYSLGTPVGTLAEKKLACYDFKSANGTIYVQSSCHTARTSSGSSGWSLYIDNVKVKDKSAVSRVSYATVGGTNNKKSYFFNGDQECEGGSGIYGITQACQMFELNYVKIFMPSGKGNTGYEIASGAGLTFATVGCNETEGNQVFVAQPQMAVIDFGKTDPIRSPTNNGTGTHLNKNIYEIKLCCDVNYTRGNKFKGGYDWFKNHRIRCIFMTKGYYDWNGDKFVSTEFTYQRYQRTNYNGFVLNIIYAGNDGESDVMVEVPANILNAYLQSMPSYIPMNDMASMTSYNPETSESRPESQSTSIFDLYSSVNPPPSRSTQNNNIREMVQKSKEKDEWVFYDVKVTIPPVQGITYVCCDTQEDIIQDKSKASIVAIGTSNGLYYMKDGVPTLSSIESGNVKKIVKVHITSSKYAYIALVDGTLYYTLDDGATWELCANDFPNTNVTDITTDIKASSKNNTAIVANGSLYYGNVVQRKVTKTDSTDKVDTTKV